MCSCTNTTIKHYVKLELPSLHIIEINNEFCDIMMYNKEEIINQVAQDIFLNTILQKHINKFFSLEISAIKEFYKIANNFSKLISKLRFVPLRKKNDSLLWAKFNPYVYIHGDKVYIYTLIHIYDESYKIAPNIPEKFLKYINHGSSTEFFVDDFKECIIIMMGVYNSNDIGEDGGGPDGKKFSLFIIKSISKF